jgi:glycosyltransferase involved in cell wall biosynthesis
MKTLWLVSWYPDKLSPFNGDFIKRHAEAVSLYDEVQVIYLVRDEKGVLTKDVLTEEHAKGNLRETIIYYYSRVTGISFLDKFFSNKKYQELYQQAVSNYLKKNGNPDIVHVHVGMKAGTVANWLREKINLPYVVSEHWTGFLPEATDRYKSLPGYYKSGWRKVMKHAKGWSSVSSWLAKALEKEFQGTKGRVIPNVVDTTIFNTAHTLPEPGRFIHISGLASFKNPVQLLHGFKIVIGKFPSAKLGIWGSAKKEIVQLAKELQLENHVSFHEEVPQSRLAEEIKKSNALILYSNYETFGCVVIEANACGIPVIVSDIPVFHETVEEGLNGSVVTPNDPAALAEKIMAIIKGNSNFDSSLIARKTARTYSYEAVGKQFSDWYREVLEKPSSI